MQRTKREADLEEQVDILTEQVRQLRAELVPQINIPAKWKLTRREAETFRHLVSREVITNVSFLTAVYTAQSDDAPEDRILAQFISRIRKKLAGYGITITTVRGRGYSLENRHLYRPKEKAAA